MHEYDRESFGCSVGQDAVPWLKQFCRGQNGGDDGAVFGTLRCNRAFANGLGSVSFIEGERVFKFKIGCRCCGMSVEVCGRARQCSQQFLNRHAFDKCGKPIAGRDAERVVGLEIDCDGGGRGLAAGRWMEIGGELALLEELGGALFEHSALDHC